MIVPTTVTILAAGLALLSIVRAADARPVRVRVAAARRPR